MTEVQVAPPPALWREWARLIMYRLRSPYGWVVASLAVGGAGLALGWEWLLAVGVLPVLLSVLPCLVMCAVGVCVMGKDKASCAGRTLTDGAAQTTSTPPLTETSSAEPAPDAPPRNTVDRS
jgi:hypothetical protein